MHIMPTTRVRAELAETLNRVAYKQERIVLQRHGKGVAAIVPIEDLEILEQVTARSLTIK